MILKKIQLLILFLCLISFGQLLACPPDSVGIVQRNGKTLILHKIKSGETLLKIAKYYRTTVQEIMEQNSNLEGSKIKTEQILYVPTGNNLNVQGIITENMLAKIDKKKTQHEIGKGEKIQSRGEEKFVLHRHAAIGSTILVINPTNHFAVKAKVIGKIPNIDINKEILVKLSSATCNALGLVNEQFAIEVIYDKK
jgi:hypothetical protein